MEQQILDDFWRTKDTLIEKIAKLIYEECYKLQKQNVEEAEIHNEHGFANNKMDSKKISKLLFEQDGFKEFSDIITDYIIKDYFSEYKLIELLRAFYNKNYDNEKGKYFEPLILLASKYLNVDFKPSISFMEFEIIKTWKKGFFIFAETFFTCKIKLCPFLWDVIQKFESFNNDSAIKFEFTERSSGGGLYSFEDPKYLYHQPIYSEINIQPGDASNKEGVLKELSRQTSIIIDAI